MKLDALDTAVLDACPTIVIRKELVVRLGANCCLPTYIIDSLVGRYCTSTTESEVQAGMECITERLHRECVRADQAVAFRDRLSEHTQSRVIDCLRVTQRSPVGHSTATLVNAGLTGVRVDDQIVADYPRMLAGGVFGEIRLSRDPGRHRDLPDGCFCINQFRPFSCPSAQALSHVKSLRESLDCEAWKSLLLRSIGMEPTALTENARDAWILRMVPFVENNYNVIEAGPRGTGKTYLYSQISPASLLMYGVRLRTDELFPGENPLRLSPLLTHDVLCFDEADALIFSGAEGISILKHYMATGEYARGSSGFRGNASLVLLSTLSGPECNANGGSLFDAVLPEQSRTDTAFMDRIHCVVPGWEIPACSAEMRTRHYGMPADLVATLWKDLRLQSRLPQALARVAFSAALSERDRTAVTKTMDGLLKLMSPDPRVEIQSSLLDWAARLACEGRQRVKQEQKRHRDADFRDTALSYVVTG